MPKENFKALVKGNSIDKIVKALGMVQSYMLNELMEEYNCTSVEELAFKLQ